MKFISKDILGDILAESQRGILNEISSEKAYADYYTDIMTQEQFMQLMGGSKKMTPFHKKALDLIKNWYERLDMNLDREWYNHNINDVAETLGRLWSTSDNKKRNELINYAQNLDPSKLLGDFVNGALVVYRTASVDSKSAKDGLKIIAENQHAMITCTTSYSASKKYFGDSKWCTASDVFGRYNGFDYFERYTSGDKCLIQLVSKISRVYTYQVAIDEYRRPCEMCNFNDDRADAEDLDNWCKIYFKKPFEDVAKVIDVETLIRETELSNEREKEYWAKKVEERKKFVNNKILSDIESNASVYAEGLKKILKEMKENYENGYESASYCNRDVLGPISATVDFSNGVGCATITYHFITDSADAYRWAEDNCIYTIRGVLINFRGEEPEIIKDYGNDTMSYSVGMCGIARKENSLEGEIINVVDFSVIAKGFLTYIGDDGYIVNEQGTDFETGHCTIIKTSTAEIISQDAYALDRYAGHYYDRETREFGVI